MTRLRRSLHRCAPLLAVAGLIGGGAQAQVTLFDMASNLVLIPSVAVGGATYRDVRLQHLGNLVFSLAGATAQTPPGAAVATFDASTGVLDLPAVKVGDQTYVGVQLQGDANFRFVVTAATLLPADVSDALRSFAASYDALYATAVPGSGALRYSLHDPCWVSDGRTRAWSIADFDADLANNLNRDAYQIGRRTVNLQVLALRDLTNADGSTRQEIDIQWDVQLTDGSTNTTAHNTVIRGSSAGAPGCPSPVSSSAFRFYGNRQMVQTAVRSRNTRDERHALGSGAALSPAVNHRRSLQFHVSDPMGHATYVIVTGPGPAATVNGVATQFSLKLISPSLLRSAPELAGKNGNYLNWLDDDGFRFCRVSGNGVPVAAVADCTGQGATSFDYGVTTGTPNSSADQNFDALGFVAGGAYRFDVYNDDGWKTVNGHAGRTPVATYFAELEQLPYTFVEMAGTGGVDRLPRLSFPSISYAQLAANSRAAQPTPVAASWTLPGMPSDLATLRLAQAWSFQYGPKAGNSGGAFYPAYRSLTDFYPAGTATSVSLWPMSPQASGQGSKSYFELSLLYSDRGTRHVISIVSFN